MKNAAGYLGIAQRARKTISGDMLYRTFVKGEIQLVIMSDDIGDNAKKKLCDKCMFYKIPYVIMESKEMAAVIANRKAIGITDKGLAEQLFACLKG